MALCSKAIPEEFENTVANKNSLTKICETIKKNTSSRLEAQLLDSMAQPIVLLSQRFMAMKIKEDCLKLNEPALNEEISAISKRSIILTLTSQLIA